MGNTSTGYGLWVTGYGLWGMGYDSTICSNTLGKPEKCKKRPEGRKAGGPEGRWDDGTMERWDAGNRRNVRNRRNRKSEKIRENLKVAARGPKRAPYLSLVLDQT